MKKILFLFFLFYFQIGWSQNYADFPTLQQGLLFSIGSQVGNGEQDGNSSIGYFANLKLKRHFLLHVNPNLEWYQNEFYKSSALYGSNDLGYYHKSGWLEYQGWNVNVPILLSYHIHKKAPLYLAAGTNFVIPLFSKANWDNDVFYRTTYNSPAEIVEPDQNDGFAFTRIHHDFVAQLGFRFPRWNWAINYTIGNRRYNGLTSFQNDQYNLSLIAFYRLSSTNQL